MFSPQQIQRVDETDDNYFYQQPRLVQHIDEGFITSLKQVFRQHLTSQAVILDLMSSWVSHLPDELVTQKVIGHGMNPVELAANPRLNEYFTQNLNRDPGLPFADNTFDAVLNTVSIQYLVDATTVLREVNRVLKPGGIVIISFSNRMFPTKAIRQWADSSEPERVALVRRYLEASGFIDIEDQHRTSSGRSYDFGFAQWLMRPKDPFYCLSARKAPPREQP